MIKPQRVHKLDDKPQMVHKLDDKTTNGKWYTNWMIKPQMVHKLDDKTTKGTQTG
jgi:hypothetical protein